MHELVRKYPRYGYWMIGAKLSQEGWHVNLKKIYRLWRREGFKAQGFLDAAFAPPVTFDDLGLERQRP